MLLIIITGLPATGKTTLGKKMAEELNLPFICKDDIKENLFDSLGWHDCEWSRKIGASSFELLYHITETLLKARQSLIIEANFDPKFANRKLLELKEKYNFVPLQIRCFAEGEVLCKRFEKRANSDQRHPGHIDSKSLDEFRPILLKGKIEVIDIEGEFFDIDTTDFEKIDNHSIFNAINTILSNSSAT